MEKDVKRVKYQDIFNYEINNKVIEIVEDNLRDFVKGFVLEEMEFIENVPLKKLNDDMYNYYNSLKEMLNYIDMSFKLGIHWDVSVFIELVQGERELFIDDYIEIPEGVSLRELGVEDDE